MLMRTILMLGVMFVAQICTPTAKADEESAKATLEAAGFTVSGAKLTTKEEKELFAAVRNSSKLRKELLTATRELAKVQGQMDQFKAKMNGLMRQRIQLNAQVGNVISPKLLGAIKTVESQLDLMKTQQPQADEALAKARGGWNKAREAYLSEVLKQRELADAATKLYEESVEDKDLQAAVKELNEETGRSFSLDLPRSLASAIRKLEKAEDEVLTESIPLRRERNTLYATVVVNDKYNKEMVVDSGASMISLPAKTAQELGIQVTADDPTIRLQLADGRIIEGKQVTLKEVRVGQFTVENVEAAVLGPEAIMAEPLLGMSFLGNFKFELDAQAGTLTMVSIEGANPADEKSSKGRKR